MMCLIAAAFKAGILDRAIEIIAGMSNEPTRQINIGKDKVRWHVHNHYWRRRI